MELCRRRGPGVGVPERQGRSKDGRSSGRRQGLEELTDAKCDGERGLTSDEAEKKDCDY